MTIDIIRNMIAKRQEYTKPEKQRIVSAANRWPDGTIIMGIRHYCPQMLLHMNLMGYSREPGVEQGFIDNYNNFLTREEAYKIANEKDQFKPSSTIYTPGVLFSEDIY